MTIVPDCRNAGVLSRLHVVYQVVTYKNDFVAVESQFGTRDIEEKVMLFFDSVVGARDYEIKITTQSVTRELALESHARVCRVAYDAHFSACLLRPGEKAFDVIGGGEVDGGAIVDRLQTGRIDIGFDRVEVEDDLE